MATKTTKATGTKIQPLADRVVVQALDEAEQTRGGLYIPDTAKEKPQQGRVVAVGPGKLSEQGERLQPDVKEGDTVLYGKYSGTEVTVDQEEYLILRESDILAVLAS
jgi:chaperonin GroES